jgi:predicted Holliday junction resolvase-like endonuclease
MFHLLLLVILLKEINIYMRFFEFSTSNNKPLTPQQQRINSLKQQKERASTALKTERERQKQSKARDALQQSQQVLAGLS